MICTYNEILLSLKIILPNAKTWLNLEDFMLSKIGKSQKDKEVSKVVISIETESGMVVTRA